MMHFLPFQLVLIASLVAFAVAQYGGYGGGHGGYGGGQGGYGGGEGGYGAHEEHVSNSTVIEISNCITNTILKVFYNATIH